MGRWKKGKNDKVQEWLGDGVVLVVARKFLLENFPHETVSRLHHVISLVVSDMFLNEVGKAINLLPDPSYDANFTNRKWNARACAVEELLCQKFLLQGFDECYRMMLPHLTLKIEDINKKLEGLGV